MLSLLEELRQFISAAEPHETHLVLAGNAGESAMRAAVERFAPVGPSHIIFTKLDEAVSFGVLVNIARRVEASLSYVTTGQEVPEQIESLRELGCDLGQGFLFAKPMNHEALVEYLHVGEGTPGEPRSHAA